MPADEPLTDSDGDLFRALLDIVWYGGHYEARIGMIGGHGAAPCIRIGVETYMVDNAVDRALLINYADRLRSREPNTAPEPLPEGATDGR